jgi:hypothetical protein
VWLSEMHVYTWLCFNEYPNTGWSWVGAMHGALHRVFPAVTRPCKRASISELSDLYSIQVRRATGGRGFFWGGGRGLFHILSNWSKKKTTHHESLDNRGTSKVRLGGLLYGVHPVQFSGLLRIMQAYTEPGKQTKQDKLRHPWERRYV